MTSCGPTNPPSGESCARDGGCNSFVPPSHSAGEGLVLWSAEVDTSAVLLAQSPAILPAAGNLYSELGEPNALWDDQGLHFVLGGVGETIRLVRLAGVPASVPLAALVPLDAEGHDRIEAVERLLRALQGRAVPPDRRLTPQQKRRHRQMLQATDGRLNGATYREIARALFGLHRVATEPWKTSALRDATSALVKDGLAMIAGGYRALLRHRRRA